MIVKNEQKRDFKYIDNDEKLVEQKGKYVKNAYNSTEIFN